MKLLRAIYRRLDRLQHQRWFSITASIAVLVLCGVVFGSLIGTTYDLEAQRAAIIRELTDQNLAARDPQAVSLFELGTVTIGAKTYGGARFQRRADLFDQDGNMIVSAALADELLRGEVPAWAPRWLLERPGTTWMLAVIATMWLLLIVWMRVALPFVLTALGTALCVAIAGLVGSAQWMWALGGMGLLTFSFVLFTRAALLAYDRPRPVLAVAHTVLREASRTRIPLVFIVLILIMLPLLPVGLDPASPLRYQVQTYISRSMGFTFYLAACMTLFLSCATVAFEIRDRQIWQLVTKPMHRLAYLVGKWLGVITVNVVILGISAVSIFTFVQYLRERPVAQSVAGLEDAQQVRDAVLTARVGTFPVYDRLDAEQIRARIDDMIERTPELAVMPEVPLARKREMMTQLIEAYATGQRSVPPGGVREYRFEGLEAARRSTSALTLRYRFHIMRDDEHETFPAVFFFNQDPNLAVERKYVPTLSHVLTIPPEIVREDGTLIVSVMNLYEPAPGRRGAGALNFEQADFELLYKVGSFEGNFFRAVVVDWVKLSFLAMLGICCATFLSFPVACLMSFTIFVAGTIGPFLARSLDEYYAPSIDAVDWTNLGMVIQWAFTSSIRSIAQVIVYALEAFGKTRPTQSLVEGRLIEWAAVAQGTLKVGLVWSGVSLLVGYLVIRSRQLAIYSGHG